VYSVIEKGLRGETKKWTIACSWPIRVWLLHPWAGSKMEVSSHEKSVPTGYGPRDNNHTVSDTISKKTREKLPPHWILLVKKITGCQQNDLILLPQFFAASAAKFENTTLVARRREHFRVFLAIFLVDQLSPKRVVLVHKNSLASCQRCRHSVEPRALTCPFKHSYLIAWSLLSWHPTHKYLWGRLCFVQACCLLSTVTVTPAETRIMSTEALLSKTVSVKIPRSAWAPGSRGTKQLETVAMKIIAATRSFYFARGIGSQASVGSAVDEEHWAEETACKRKRIEISLVFVTIILHALTYVFSIKLFWNWNGDVRFVSQEVWFDKGFVI